MPSIKLIWLEINNCLHRRWSRSFAKHITCDVLRCPVFPSQFLRDPEHLARSTLHGTWTALTHPSNLLWNDSLRVLVTFVRGINWVNVLDNNIDFVEIVEMSMLLSVLFVMVYLVCFFLERFGELELSIKVLNYYSLLP